VRSINLIPAEQRRGAGGLAGRAGGAAYVVVGALAVFVLMGVFYALAVGQVSSRQTKLAQVTAQTTNTQAQAAVLAPYVQFASIRQQRQASITALATSRFDWSEAMDQIARALPNNVTLSSLAGTGGPSSAPSAPVAGTTAPVVATPSVNLTGCATSHSEVAQVLVDLNKVEGVSSVTLASSTKTAPAAGGSSGSGSSASTAGGCNGATFTATLTYAAGAGEVSPITVPTTSGSTR
jgi:Tfp pilus assembly protein PilN